MSVFHSCVPVRSYVPERVKDGIFGAMMNVQLVNDGPVTLILDSQNNGKG